MKVGKVISVEFDRFRVKMFHTTKNSTISINGQIYYFGNIGSFLKTTNAIGETIICEVVAILDHTTESKMYTNYNLDSSRELIVKPIGSINHQKKFHLGIGVYPSLYADVYIVTFEDIKSILETEKDLIGPNTVHESIAIGSSKNLINYEIKLNINNLFNIHTAILGNSGSGKSNTISHILQSVYRKEGFSASGSKTILFDVNGEYHSAFKNSITPNNSFLKYYIPNKNEDEDVGNSTFILPYYLMNLDEWLAFLMASDRTQKPFWDKVLQQTYKFYKIFNSDEEDDFIYINYFKWKLITIIRNVISRIDSDTSKMTAVQSILFNIEQIFNSLNTETATKQELKDFIVELRDYSNIKYGDNNNQLNDYINSLDEHINIESALDIENHKLEGGNYFDYKFLQSACDLVLLDEEGKGNTRIREYTSTMLTRLEYFLHNSDCTFLKEGVPDLNREQYLKQYFGIGNEPKNQLIVIDTNGLSNDILELTTSLISRLLFDVRKSKNGDDRVSNPIHLVLDEAHRYIRKDATYLLSDNIFERIAREGRKYALYLIVSSQRPSELSSTVLSQCGNYFIHRIQNEVDMKYIYSVLPYFTDDYVAKIKQSMPGEVLIFGNCVPMPLQVKVHQPNPEPNSKNCIINEEWFK
ncbi:ATP-binding protein [Myroides odoratimimus]|uniref:ATP-binding protein n=1 Tax=Myroides odoratimimus TaxID=76832 RepID=UPI0025763331|nr:DUF87 domain-containing protein [Myroides odoratimimus]MDM1410560.1 ATP-binding protein [Myroides odoratimimus]